MKISLPDFTKTRILVIGDVMLDRYWSGDTARISPEAPVPVVKVNHVDDRPGGAGNVALNIAALEGKVTLIGITGIDETHKKLCDIFTSTGIDFDFVQSDQHPTITKLRVISQHQQLIRLDFEEKWENFLFQKALLEKAKKHIANAHAMILSDYGKGVLHNPQPFIQLAKKHNIPVFVDPKSNDFSVYDEATCITPNLKEFEAVVGSCKAEQDIVSKAKSLLKNHHLEYLLVTRGKDGMSLFHNNDEELHIPTEAKEVFDVSGAGDTSIAMLALSYAAKIDIESAVKLANAAAGVVVGKLGAATCSIPELQRAIQKTPSGGVLNEDQLFIEIQHAKRAKEKIVFTNGCFDILHAGHVFYLNEAKKLGDRLIVGVNDDNSVKKLKGDSRPINSLEKRMAVLAGLSSVDWVVPFSEDTPERLICRLLPDVLVKGGDYKPEEVAGSSCVIKNNGEVKILGFVEGCSTTEIIEKGRIKK